MIMKNNARLSKILRMVLKYLTIFIGSALYAAGFQFILFPNSIPTGGVGGIAMILNRFTNIPVGVLIILINIPLFLISMKKLGWRFMVSSLVGMTVSSVCIDVMSLFSLVLTAEPFLICIYGGLLYGVGLGIVYRTGATTGGSDIIAKLIRKRLPYVNLGTLILIIDVVIILSYAVIFDRLESALYALITMFIASKLIDLVLYGADMSKLCYIISDNSDAVRDHIFKTLDRGVTFLQGTGGYSGKDKKVIMCVIRPRQIVELRAAVRAAAPDAFIIITDAREVFGNGFSDVSEVE